MVMLTNIFEAGRAHAYTILHGMTVSSSNM
jgi:hypothetical protein